MKRKNYKWTDEQIAILKQDFATSKSQDIADDMGIDVKKVQYMAFKLGLKKDPAFQDFLTKDNFRRMLESGKVHRFKKGNIPPNKGRKLTDEEKDKFRKFFWEKGHTPTNTKELGYERICANGYVHCKVGAKTFRPKHNIVYADYHGKIPEGCVIMFADGNKRNFAIENLIAVPRSEFVIRTTNKKYGDEILENVLLLHRIKKIIKNK